MIVNILTGEAPVRRRVFCWFHHFCWAFGEKLDAAGSQAVERMAHQNQALPFRVVAVGTSAGGLAALQALLGLLPAAFPWPIVIVQHLQPSTKSLLPIILNRGNQLQVKQGEAGETLVPSTVYIAPPNYHMTITSDRTIALNKNPKVHFSRPAIDYLFKSVAAVSREQAIAIILTGSNTDGAEGMQAVKANGGLTLVQAPPTAKFPKMPQAAIATGAVDGVLAIAAIADKLVQLAYEV